MANHKRGKSSNQRAGCKLCKPWKISGNHNGWTPKRPTSDLRALQYDINDGIEEYYEEQESFYEDGPHSEFIDTVLPFLIEYNVR